MKWLNNQTITTTLLLVVFFFSGMAWWQLSNLQRGIQRVIEQNESPMQTISQEVTNTQAETATISTTRLDEESIPDWLGRHQAAVDAFESSGGE